MGVTGPEQPHDFPRKTADSGLGGADSGAVARNPALEALARRWGSLAPQIRLAILTIAGVDPDDPAPDVRPDAERTGESTAPPTPKNPTD